MSADQEKPACEILGEDSVSAPGDARPKPKKRSQRRRGRFHESPAASEARWNIIIAKLNEFEDRQAELRAYISAVEQASNSDADSLYQLWRGHQPAGTVCFCGRTAAL